MPNHEHLWNDLNPRQRHYLKAIFNVDQELERDHKDDYFRGVRSSASDWRWMNYDAINLEERSWLQCEIGDDAIDEGTGSTLSALGTRGLIAKRGHPKIDNVLQVQLTKLGRAVARAGLGIKRAVPPKKVKQPVTPPPETDLTRWGKALRAWRGNRGLRQLASDGLIGDLSIATFSRLENGKPPTYEQFVMLCGICGLSQGDYPELRDKLKGAGDG